MARYELITSQSQESGENRQNQSGGLPLDALKQNAAWFVRLRWVVALVFLAAGCVGWLLRNHLLARSVSVPFVALWVLAAVLVICNLGFLLLVRSLREATSTRAVNTVIWMQIATDLVVVTLLVHFIGSTDTFIAFAYLFHITLACIFFPPRESLLVLVLAAVLYCVLLVLEAAGRLPPTGAFSNAATFSRPNPGYVVQGVSALFIWLVVWYLVSTLSDSVRQRDQLLTKANASLRIADEEKNRQMLITTHDLKSPFAGIESNIQILKYQHWDSLDAQVKTIMEKIDTRAHVLRNRINAILLLGNLKAVSHEEPVKERVNLNRVVTDVVEGLQERAGNRSVEIATALPDLHVLGDGGQLTTLFANLVSNAIAYSREGGKVEVSAEMHGGVAEVSVQDYGIGIRADALPNIFDEYYRTQEASHFNRESTGLGLAIVKVIADRFGLSIIVDSEEGKGTRFTVRFPDQQSRRGGKEDETNSHS